MIQKEKKHLTLNVDAEIANKAVADPNINVSEITEKILRAFTTSSKTADKDKLYEMYQELFNLMLSLLKKFKVNTPIAHIFFEEASDETFPYVMPNEERHSIDLNSVWLEPDGSFTSDGRFDYDKITKHGTISNEQEKFDVRFSQLRPKNDSKRSQSTL